MRRKKNRFQEIAGTTWQVYGPGEQAAENEFDPGDFILTQGTQWHNRVIRWGQSLRHRGRYRKYIKWTHAALIVSRQGDLIEAVGSGVRRSHLREYKDVEYRIVHLGGIATDHDREKMLRFAEWCLGEEYGYATIASIGISLLMGGKFKFGFDGQAICSGLVARALERTGAIFDKDPSHILPADLARYFKVVDE
ncbi:MAG: hypothetical protein ONB48_07930 [candidate division KSB1 bacterium]|nr:hypothetical protein [candidate division KSB1 bacterium]MDZ7274752.1 hypothetical protein [candidate division KSB1 bacterium]MDZ7285577.1 hypothetical protein [candidate division KSB1 bacterium]MDZ7298609.1 hypothetical protein [candidate division KSB1 bacterium]MDZ7309535.1 hypothetical protein [candidate division KSB1 bacterium]